MKAPKPKRIGWMCNCQFKIRVKNADPKATFNMCMCSRGCRYCYENKPRFGVDAI